MIFVRGARQGESVAYAASRFTFRGKGPLMVGILMVQMISPLVVIIPLSRSLDQLGLLESHLSVIAFYMAIGVPLSVWLILRAIMAGAVKG